MSRCARSVRTWQKETGISETSKNRNVQTSKERRVPGVEDLRIQGRRNRQKAQWPNKANASESERRDQERTACAACGVGVIGLCRRWGASHAAAAQIDAKGGLNKHIVRVMLGYVQADVVMGSESLNKEQARLVEEHLHLVREHLRRHVSCPRRPTRSRERDDLYQAGCLGLIEAARLYDGDGGIPFSAFALRRIHHAVSRTAYEGFSTV